MKKIFLLTLLISFIGNAQIVESLNYKDLNTSTTSELTSKTIINVYTDKSGNEYKEGMKLFFGESSGMTLVTAFGGGTQKAYENIRNGTPEKIGKAFIKWINADTSLKGKYLIIDKLYLYKNKYAPETCIAVALPEPGASFIDKNIYFLLEKAIDSKEIINPNAKITKEMAIKILKEKKELFDLGILSKEEYDKIKTEYTSVILSNL